MVTRRKMLAILAGLFSGLFSRKPVSADAVELTPFTYVGGCRSYAFEIDWIPVCYQHTEPAGDKCKCVLCVDLGKS